MREYWEENLHTLNRSELIGRLEKISSVFNGLPIPDDYESDQLCFIAEVDYERMLVELTKCPLKRIRSLRNSHDKNLILLYYYDPTAQINKVEETLHNVKVRSGARHPRDFKNQQIRLLNKNSSESPKDSWFYPDEEALQVLIKKGMIHLKDLMDELGLAYDQV
jgi:hypothetical protein